MTAAELRALCVRVLAAETEAEAFPADDALMKSDDGSVCPVTQANRILAALDDAAIPRWRPIETAPADVEVIVRVRTGGTWRVREAVGTVDRLGWIWRTSDGTAVDARHWSPIPTEAP